MFELTGIASVLRGIGVVYWLLAIGAIGLAIWKGKDLRAKAIWVGVAIAVFGFLPAKAMIERARHDARLAKAEAMFQERCKTAGEKIHRTVNNVEGVFLLKVRPEEINYGNQFAMDDPYGRDLGGEGYIKNFLLGRNARGSLVDINPVRNGYRYVEVVDLKDGRRYRYTGVVRVVGKQDATAHNIQAELKRNPNYDLNIYAFVLDKTIAPTTPPRYGVTYDDISTREERDYWIAGGSLKVIDLEANEVIAERIGYMMDRQQGDRSGGRSPWLLAARNACPAFPVTPGGQPFKMDQTRDFVEKVLRM